MSERDGPPSLIAGRDGGRRTPEGGFADAKAPEAYLLLVVCGRTPMQFDRSIDRVCVVNAGVILGVPGPGVKWEAVRANAPALTGAFARTKNRFPPPSRRRGDYCACSNSTGVHHTPVPQRRRQPDRETRSWPRSSGRKSEKSKTSTSTGASTSSLWEEEAILTRAFRDLLRATLLNPVAVILLVTVVGVIYLAAHGIETPRALWALMGILAGTLSMMAMRGRAR